MEERIKKFLEEFKKEKLTKKYLYKNVWTSGSQTEVSPFMVFKNEVIIQWNCDKNIFDKFINRIVEKNKNLIKYGYFSKSDGSCPSSISFIFK